MGLDPITILAISGAVGAGAATLGVMEQRKATKAAQADAALERERLAALQAEPEPVVPTTDDETIRRSRQRSISAQMRRRGRTSTILTNSTATDPLGT